MLPCVCSVIDHKGRQNGVRTSVIHSAAPRVPLLCSYHILTSSMIYYWTDARQHGIYLLISSQFCMSINFVPFPVALACNFTPGALLCIRFLRIFVLHQLLLSTEQFYPTHNWDILQSSASANMPLCHTFCYPVLCHCCSSITSQGVHSPAHCAY